MDKQYEYMTLFFFSVSLCLGSPIDVESKEFNNLLLGFIVNYYEKYHALINKIFAISIENGEANFKINYKKIYEYSALFSYNPPMFCKIYDDVGDNDNLKITKLANEFCYYMYQMIDMNKTLIKH